MYSCCLGKGKDDNENTIQTEDILGKAKILKYCKDICFVFG